MSATFEHAIAASTPRERSGRAFRVVRIILGLLLLTAAGLKLYGMNVTALPRAGWFATPRVQIMAAEWELVLGLWLLSGVFQFCAWLAAIGTFATFAGVSAYFGWIGVANCGCFGVIHTSPWVAFAVDVAALVGLGLGRPPSGTFTICGFARLAVIPLAASVVLAGLTVTSLRFYESTETALAQLRGEMVTADPNYLDLGAGEPGETLEGAVEICNWSETPIRLIGGTSDCSCITTSTLPLTIPPAAKRPLAIRLIVPARGSGLLTRTAEIWTDNADRPPIVLHVAGRIECRH